MHKTKETIGTENTAKNTDQAETKAYFLSSFLTKAWGPSLYYVSKKTGWGQKIAIFADV